MDDTFADLWGPQRDGACSHGLTTSAKVSIGLVDPGSLSVELFVSEAGLGWPDVVLLSHLEVLSEGLVTAPPVEVDHANALVPPNLMGVGVTNVVLDTVDWESSVSVAIGVELVGLSNAVSPVLNHSLLPVLLTGVEHEGAEQVEASQEVDPPESVLSVEDVSLPVGVADWVLVEARDILEGSPSLGIVSWLVGLVHKLSEVAIRLLGKGTGQRGTVRVRREVVLTGQPCRRAH